MIGSVSQEEKICTICGNGRVLKGRRWCKACYNEYRKERYKSTPAAKMNNNLKTMYGITLEQYNTMVADQGGVCAICQQTNAVARLVVDHCHITGAVRSLLCQRCNIIVGMLETNLDRLDMYLQYIQRHQES